MSVHRTPDPAEASSRQHSTRTRRDQMSVACVAALRLASEILIPVSLAAWSLDTRYAAPTRSLLAMMTAGGAAVAWGRLIAPRSAGRLADPARLVIELALFSASGAAISTITQPTLGLSYTAAAASISVLVRRTEQSTTADDSTATMEPARPGRRADHADRSL